MNVTTETAAEEVLPKYAELLRLLQMGKPERFAELARTYNTDDEREEALKSHNNRHKYAGKILCAARTMWDELVQQRRNRQETFPDYFEMQNGCRPSTHGSSCAKAYRSFVLTGKIAESDYDESSTHAIETASSVIYKVKGDLNHPAVAAAALILRERSRTATSELKALLDRLIEDSDTGQMRLFDQAQAAEINARLTYSDRKSTRLN